jgi:hypothetical protein
MRSTSLRLGLLALLATTAFLACKSEETSVARLRAEPEKLALGWAEYRDVALVWEPTAQLDPSEGTPTVFVHLLRKNGEIEQTFDHPLPSRWQPGTPLRYNVRVTQSAIAPPLAPGKYWLTAGLYGSSQGERWPLAVEGEGRSLPRHEYALAEIEVAAGAPANAPQFAFSPNWGAPEPGQDRQVLARRWLNGEGTLEAKGPHPAGTLWLALLIPDAPAGTVPPAVSVSSPCGGFASFISGAGRHEIEIPVRQPLAAGTGCAISLRPNFPPRQGRSVALEGLAWGPVRTESL